MNRISAAVVGLGKIGQGYDYHLSDNRLILTHARAYNQHDGYELVAAVDIDKLQRERFTARFGRPAYANVESMMVRHQPDVVSICVPTAQHFQVMRQIISFKPRAVLCEKPIAAILADAENMVKMAEAIHCVLLVNYLRRFEPGVLALRKSLMLGDVGKVEKGVCWYSKGILNNGSHYIDLLRFLLGEVTELRLLNRGCGDNDFDPEPDFYLRFGQVPVYFLAAREDCFSVGRFELMGSAGHILYDDFGDIIRIRKTRADKLFPGYRVLDRKTKKIPTDMGRYQWYVIEHLHRHLITGEPLISDGRTASETLAVVEKINRSSQEGNL